MSTPRSAAIYARISKDITGERLGVDRQLEDCYKLTRELGWQVGDAYVDNDVSAYSGKPRPEYRRLLDDLRSGDRDAVIAWHTDRLHRSPLELEEYIEICERRGVETRTVRAGALDLSTASGRTVARIHGAISRGESERMSERMRRGNRQRAEQGPARNTGVRCYGYTRDGMSVIESEAAIIRQLVDRFLAGEPLAALVRWLNDNEIPTATGNSRWYSAGTRGLLRRARLSGQREYHGEIVAPGTWPAIITPEQTAAVRRILDHPDRRITRAPSRYLLTRLILCGKCSRPMISHPRSGVPGYDCRSDGGLGGCGKTSIKAEPVEEYVRDMVLTALDGPHLAAAITRRDTGDTNADALADNIRRDQAQLDEVAAAFADGDITRDQLRTATKRLTERITAHTDKLAALNGHRDLARYLGRGRELTDSWAAMTLDQRRAVIRSIVEAVHIGPATPGRGFDPDRIEIRWRA